jgi:protein TonB
MFEDSLVESKSAPISATKQWTTLSSIAIQAAVATLIIAFPMLHPEQLPLYLNPPHVLLPLPPKPPIEIKPAQSSAKPASHSVSTLPANVQQTVSHFPIPNTQTDPEGPLAPISLSNVIWASNSLPPALAVGNPGPTVSTSPVHPAAPLKISAGVSAGMLLSPIRPVYPAIARATHTEGTVILEAVISRAGTIESLRVVSGPEMLRSAALDAIRAARYQPYRLSGEPIEVQTTITVNFRFNS